MDVFFVISGYLITSIILAELEQGTFSIANFYERRARRILPALFLVMLVCLPCAWLWLLPQDMKDFSHSLIAVTAFCSNILFCRADLGAHILKWIFPVLALVVFTELSIRNFQCASQCNCRDDAGDLHVVEPVKRNTVENFGLPIHQSVALG